MATDVATLALKVENGDVVKATSSVGSLEVAGDKAEKAAGRLSRRMALLQIEAHKMDEAMRRGGAAMNALEAEARQMDAALDKDRRAMALIEIEARKMDAALTKSRSGIAGFAQSMGVSEGAALKLGRVFGVLGGITAAGLLGREFLRNTIEAQNAMAQLEAAVASTGGVAGRTVAELDALSASLQRTTTFSDEAVKGAEAMLLTFDKIRGANFDRATAAVTDLAARMGGDLQGAAVQVGKALQDPATGLTALRRSGVSFSAAQIEVIKNLYATGKAAEGQRVILAELEHQFGGSAAAARNTLGGALTGLKNDFGELFEQTKDETGALVGFINAVSAGIRDVHAYADEIKAVALALGGVAVAYGVATVAAKSFAVQAVFSGAATAAEGLAVAIGGIGAALTGTGAVAGVALGPIALLATAAALAIYDLKKAFDDYDESVEEASKNTREYVEYLKALGRAHAHAPEVAPPAAEVDPDAAKKAQKFREELAQRDLEIRRQQALNGVIGASSATMALLNNAYDARAERAKNAIDHTAAETVALNKRTNALLAAKDAAVLEAEAVANRKQVAEVQRGDSEAVRNARQELELAGLSEEAAAQRRVDMQAENDLAAARLRFAQMTRDLDKERADIAAGILQREQDIYDSTAKRVEAVRQIGHETATVTTEMEKQKKAQEEADRDMERRAKELRRTLSSTIEGFITDVTNKRNPFVALFDNLKRGAIKAMSDILASKIEGKVGDFLGIQTPASKQEKAAREMNVAADKMLRAGQQMNDSVPGDGLVGSTSDRKVLGIGVERWKQAMGIGASAYGGFQIGQGIGQATGDKALGALGGAASGALAGAAIAGPLGAAVGGIAGAAGGLLGAAKAAAEARRRLEEAKEAWNNLRDSLTAEFNKDDQAAQIAQINAKYDEARKAFAASDPIGALNNSNEAIAKLFDGGEESAAAYAKELARLNVEEKARIEQIKEEIAILRTRRLEDYQQRLDEATPGNEREEAIAAFNRKEDRELEDLKRSFGPEIDAVEAATYAIAEQAIAAEKAKFATEQNTKAINDLNTSVRNAPEGFKLEPYIQEFAVPTPRSMPTPINPIPLPTNPFTPPMTPTSQPTFSRSSTGTVATAPARVTFGDITVTVAKTNASADDIAKSVVRKLDEYAASLGGLNSDRIAALKRYPSA